MQRTQAGLVLAIIGIVMSFIPPGNWLLAIVRFAFGIVFLIGVVSIIAGRHAFGPTHARNVILSVILWFLAVGFLVFAGALIFEAATRALLLLQSGSTLATAMAPIDAVFAWAVAAAVLFGLSWVLLTYALQEMRGKALLWAALAVSLALTTWIVLVVRSAIVRFATGGDPATTYADLAFANTLVLLAVVPQAMFAAGLYLAWRRIFKREIPVRAAEVPARGSSAGATSPKTALKDCPSCGAAVPASANVCFMCGYAFAALGGA